VVVHGLDGWWTLWAASGTGWDEEMASWATISTGPWENRARIVARLERRGAFKSNQVSDPTPSSVEIISMARSLGSHISLRGILIARIIHPASRDAAA